MSPADVLADLEHIYRDLHAHPELAFAEVETTAYLEQQLRSAGLAPQLLPSGTGLVASMVPRSSAG